MTTALAIIIFVLAAIYYSLVHAREEKAAIQEGKVSAKHIGRIKRKIALLSIIASDKSLFAPLVDAGVALLGVAVFIFSIVVLPFALSGGAKFNTYGGMLFLGMIAGTVVLFPLWGKIHHLCKCQLHYLKNKLQFLEGLQAAQRDGHDGVTLNAVKQVLEHELQLRNEVVPKLANIEIINECLSIPRREGSLSAQFAKALHDECSSRIESGKW